MDDENILSINGGKIRLHYPKGTSSVYKLSLATLTWSKMSDTGYDRYQPVCGRVDGNTVIPFSFLPKQKSN